VPAVATPLLPVVAVVPEGVPPPESTAKVTTDPETGWLEASRTRLIGPECAESSSRSPRRELPSLTAIPSGAPHQMSADETPPRTVTRLLDDVRRGEPDAADQLLPLVYAELRGIAEKHMRGERPDHTLQPTALVHEAYLRLLGGTPIPFESRVHFLRTASQVMRRVLVDHARARNRTKRGGGINLTLDDAIAGAHSDIVELLVVDDVLTQLAAAEPRWAQVAEMRIFGGLEVDDVAAALGISAPTVKRDWKFAKAWLAHALRDPGEDASP
jgi:RNA polymerase sigma factor (TIGR02999 family)